MKHYHAKNALSAPHVQVDLVVNAPADLVAQEQVAAAIVLAEMTVVAVMAAVQTGALK